jgi:hypothetical protein
MRALSGESAVRASIRFIFGCAHACVSARARACVCARVFFVFVHFLAMLPCLGTDDRDGSSSTIGLSNFNRRQVAEVQAAARKYKPTVLQVRCVCVCVCMCR